MHPHLKKASHHVRRVYHAAKGHVVRYGPQPHHWRWGGLVTVALVAAALFFVIGAGVRLLTGPVSLGPLSGQLQSSIANALPGLAVRYDEAALEWTRDEGRLNLVILGARVFDENQRIIAQAPKAEIDLAAAPFLRGKIEIKRIALVGVQLTLVRTKDGHVRLGMEQENGQSDVLESIRKALANSGAGASSLQSFAVRKARLAFYDEGTGLFVVAPDARLEVSTTSGAARKAGLVEASVDAQIEISGHRAHIVGSAKLPEDDGDVKGDVSITGLDVSALGSNAKAFEFLKPYMLTTDLSGSFTLSHGTHVRYADFGVGAQGIITAFGPPVHVKTLRLVGRYDGATGRLLIDDGTLAGNEASAHLSGNGDLSFSPDGVFTQAALDLTMDKILLDMRGVTTHSVALDRISLRGVFTAADQHFTLAQFLASGGALSAELTGGITLVANKTPAVDLDGKIAAMDVHDTLHYWPLKMGGGARDWIEENISVGRVGPILIHTHIPAGALDLPVLPEDALNVKVVLSGGTVSYVKGLTPITQAEATGVLTGDTFTANLTSGKVGAMTISKGQAVIHDLHASKSVGDLSAHVEGAVPEMLALIDMKPLQYPSRFHVKTDGAKGNAAIDLSFRVPMLKALKVDDIGISVKGGMHDLVLGFGDNAKVTNGALDFAVDNSALHAAGTVNVGGAKLAIDWTEQFKSKSPYTTTLTAKGMIDDAARNTLNFHSADFITGPINVDVAMQGSHGTIRQAQATLDLTPATVMLDLINYRKPQGVSAKAELTAQFDATGAVTAEDILLTGAGGLSAKGTVNFGDDGKMQHVSLPFVRAGAANDFALEMTETQATGLVLSLTGHSADGTGLGRQKFDSTDQTKKPKGPLSEPFHVTAKLDQVVLRNGVNISNFALDASGVGDRPQSLSVSGAMSKTATLSAGLTTDAGVRQLKFNTNDAGQLIKGLFGFTSIHGGSLDVSAKLSPPPGKKDSSNVPVDFNGAIVIRDFKVTNQPFLARLFSAASFGGFADILRGDGIGVDKLQVPFRMHGGVLDIYDARASGPSLGITADGYIDRRSNQIALEGAFAPLSGINNILGAIPLVGDVLVSKKGEGVIGMSYAVSGNADEPQISVNPLSVLTPGIFRRIFEGTPHAPPAEANTGSTATPPSPKTP